jgi:hypothetical protein
VQNLLNGGVKLGRLGVVRPGVGQRLGGVQALQRVVVEHLAVTVVEPFEFSLIVAHDDRRPLVPEFVVYYWIVRFAIAIVVEEIRGYVGGVQQFGIRHAVGRLDVQSEYLDMLRQRRLEPGQAVIFAAVDLEIRLGGSANRRHEKIKQGCADGRGDPIEMSYCCAHWLWPSACPRP